MSDPIVTPDTPIPTPVTATPVVVDSTARLADLESQLQAKASEFEAAMAASADLAKKLEALVTERDAATAAVTRLEAAAREAAILDAVLASVPHAPKGDVRRALRGMAAEGKMKVVDTDPPDRVAAEAISVLRAEGSALLRVPVGAGGGTNPVTQVAPPNPLLAVFGPRRK